MSLARPHAPRRLPAFALSLAAVAAVAARQAPPPDTPDAKATAPEKEKEKEKAEFKGTGRRGPVRTVVTDMPRLVAAHNRERAKIDKTLPTLTVNPLLTAAAAAHAKDQAERGEMSHEGADGSHPADRVKRAGYQYLACGENVAYGSWTPDRLMQGWMDSPPHRKNILGDFTEIGAARATAVDGNNYWAVVFGKPWPKLDPATAEADLLAAINEARAAEGKPAMAMHPTLRRIAGEHAAANAKRGGFAPDDAAAENPFRKVAAAGYRYAEIGLANGFGQPDPRGMVEGWLGEPAHRERLLGTMRDAGVGFARGADGVPFWTLILAKPRR
jgi:uncharacterized protein YkwD